MANRSDWFRKETADDSFEPTIDMLLNSTFFVWFGVVCPWDLFASSIVSLWRLVVLAIVILLLRRPVVLLLLQRFLRQVDGIKDATFVGFFGPIGVSALFYQHLTLEFLHREIHAPDGSLRGDVKAMSEIVKVTIWFIVLCSIVSALHAFQGELLGSSANTRCYLDRSRPRDSSVSGCSLPFVVRASVSGKKARYSQYNARRETICHEPSVDSKTQRSSAGRLGKICR